MVVLVLQEQVLVCAVGSESDGCNAQAREEALEAVPPGEGASVAPGLTKTDVRMSLNSSLSDWVIESVLASPGIPLSVDRGGRGRSLELGDIKAGGVSGRHDRKCEKKMRGAREAGAEHKESRVKPQKAKDVKPGAVRLAECRGAIPDTEVDSSPAFRGTKLNTPIPHAQSSAYTTMPPPPGRFGPQGLGAPYTLQQAHLQSQHPAHAQSANTALPPPSLGGHPGFAGNPNTNMNPFTLSSAGVANGMSVAGFGGAGADGGGTGLASHAAQMGFARGAQMQQQQLSQGHDGRLALDSKTGAVKTRIRDVWKHNLAHEMAVLRQLVDKYPYISMVRR